MVFVDVQRKMIDGLTFEYDTVDKGDIKDTLCGLLDNMAKGLEMVGVYETYFLNNEEVFHVEYWDNECTYLRGVCESTEGILHGVSKKWTQEGVLIKNILFEDGTQILNLLNSTA